MATITLSVPDNLKKRMEHVEWINWSSVARKAFADKLCDVEELERGRKIAEISGISHDDKRVVREEVVREVLRSTEETEKLLQKGKIKAMSPEEFNKWCDSL